MDLETSEVGGIRCDSLLLSSSSFKFFIWCLLAVLLKRLRIFGSLYLFFSVFLRCLFLLLFQKQTQKQSSYSYIRICLEKKKTSLCLIFGSQFISYKDESVCQEDKLRSDFLIVFAEIMELCKDIKWKWWPKFLFVCILSEYYSLISRKEEKKMMVKRKGGRYV